MGAMASGGSGRRISTLLAEERSLNCERAFTRYSVRLRLCFSTMHSTQISGRTFWFNRYVLPELPHVRQELHDVLQDLAILHVFLY